MTTARRRRIRVGLVAWLTAIWTLLWGSLSLASVGAGLLVALVLVLVFPPAPAEDGPVVVRPVACLALFWWFVGALIVTNLRVAREVLVPRARSRIRTAIVAVPLRAGSGLVTTVIANVITLTPGTLTVEVRGRPAVLYVHVLTLDSEEVTRADVAAIERRVVAAIGSRSDRAALGPTSADGGLVS